GETRVRFKKLARSGALWRQLPSIARRFPSMQSEEPHATTVVEIYTSLTSGVLLRNHDAAKSLALLAETIAQQRLLRLQRVREGARGEYEQEERAVVVQREAPEHPARLAVHQIDVLIARAIARSLERRDGVAKTFLEPGGPKASLR